MIQSFNLLELGVPTLRQTHMSHMSDTDDTGYIDLFGKHLKDTMATLLLNDYPDILKNFPIIPFWNIQIRDISSGSIS